MTEPIRRNSFRPTLESLEGRWCPSAVKFTPERGSLSATLSVLGDASTNIISITDDVQSGALQVTVDGQTTSFSIGSLKRALKIEVKEQRDSFKNDDVFDYRMLGSPAQPRKLDVRLGDGNDTISIALVPTSSSELIGQNVDVSVDAGSGDDQVTFRIGEVSDASVKVTAKLGAGDDTFHGHQEGDLLGRARVSFEADGSRGNDTLDVTAVTDDVNADGSGIDIDKHAQLSITLKGGSDDDALSVAYAGRLDGDLKLKLDGGDGANSLRLALDIDEDGNSDRGKADVSIDGGRDIDEVFVTLGAVSDASVKVTAKLRDGDDAFHGRLTGDLSGHTDVVFDVDGGKDNDVLDVNATTDDVNADGSGIDIGEEAQLRVTCKGSHGDDTLSFAYSGILDGGLRFLLDGGQGDDLVSAAAIFLDAASHGGWFEGQVLGNTEDDTLSFELIDDSHHGVNIRKALVDGGRHVHGDHCQATSNVKVKNCDP